MLIQTIERSGALHLAVPEIERWGGAECTVNRVGDRFRDQLVETGHHERLSDFELIAGMGFAAVRFPVLWERVSPDQSSPPDWSWSDARLDLLRAAGIRPIAGLLHHGSGPRHTSLIDDGFATGLADHARAVAMRYPWITDWTPVNEPLTTARFSALYGLWYPHARDERLFWLALLNQIDATRLAMRATREIQPAARLVQTEDLGRTYATAGRAGQAAFDNQRRWMTWDLLCGMVGPAHPLWERLCRFGFRSRLRAILEDPCPPGIIGIDHYLTSDRLLDERFLRYPPATRGGNKRQYFADVEAVRVLTPPPHGLAGALSEAWERYNLPIAVTEVHNGCTREEQVRWLEEAWAAARAARAEGIDVRAITAWAMFGSSGWDTLLTGDGTYEPGVFDVSSGRPRETALAAAVRDAGSPPGLAGAGWWRRDVRLIYPASPRPATMAEHRRARLDDGGNRPPILIAGATGTLGQSLAVECRRRDLPFVLTGRQSCDLHDAEAVERTLDRVEPWAVINAAGWVRVDDAENEPDACRAINTAAAVGLAGACARRAIATLNFSSDLVFDGQSGGAYREDDPPSPLNVYGHSKADMEAGVGVLDGNHLVIRTAAFFSQHDRHNFAVHCLSALAAGRPFAASPNCVITPTYVPDLCRSALDLLIDGEAGIWHVTNGEALSWLALAERLARATGLDASRLEARDESELGWIAPRPAHVPLASSRGSTVPSLQSAIDRFAAGYAAQTTALECCG